MGERNNPLHPEEASTLAGYAKMLETVYPMIGGLPLCKIRAVHLEEMCEELRRRPGKQGSTMSEATVQKYLDTVSAVLENARKNDILLYNPALRVDKLPVRKKPQRIPQSFEIEHPLQCFFAGADHVLCVLPDGSVHGTSARGAVRPAVE